MVEYISNSFFHLLYFQVYAAWETDEVIGFELWRNLGLALVCVFVITLMLLANIPICMMVLLCVALTLVSHQYCALEYPHLLSFELKEYV